MHTPNTPMKARNDMIDFLITHNEGGIEIDGEFIPVYDLTDQQLALLCYEVGEECYGIRVSKHPQKGSIHDRRIRGRCRSKDPGISAKI